MGGLVVAVKPKDEAHNVIMLNNREGNGERAKKDPDLRVNSIFHFTLYNAFHELIVAF
jgi:hypothetical protein